MESIQILIQNNKKIKIFYFLLAFLFLPVLIQCSTKKVMDDDDARFADINEEYNKVVKVKSSELPNTPMSESQNTNSVAASKTSEVILSPTTQAVKSAPKPILVTPAKKIKGKAMSDLVKMKPREPDYEDNEGFNGRRPIIDPYHPGEKMVLSVNYFNMVAGDIIIETLPYKLVNEKKAYHYSIKVETTPKFSFFYAVKNVLETFVDFETLVPHTFTVDARESARIKESKTYFDWKSKQANLWEKVVKKDGKEKKVKKVWDIEPYTQNVISSAFYLRSFQLKPGKNFSFRIADDGKNYTFKGEVLRVEDLDTEIGTLSTVVVRPTFTLEGQFKPTGENLMWFTNDDQKLLVRFESKIKIGTLVAKIKTLERGLAH
jgi:hypothetical protein